MSTTDEVAGDDADHEPLPAEVTDLDPAAIGEDEAEAEEEALAEAGPSDEELAEEPFVDGTVGRSDLAAERDEYLEALQRVKAEFDNYRKRVERERTSIGDRAEERLVGELLPVLDACDAAVAHDLEGVEAIRSALVDALAKQGLEVMECEGKPFDPTLHDAVMSEEGDGEQVVLEVLRKGYTWRGRVVRPAMVKVKT